MNKGNEYVSPKSQFSQNFSLAFRLPSRTRCVENREISRLMPLWQACKQPTQPSSVGHQLCSSVDHWSSKLRSHHRHSGQFHRLHMLLIVSSSNWQSSSTELFMAQHPGISLKKSAMSLVCRWTRGRVRSSTPSLLDVRPSRRATVADRSFATAACPRIWNGVPDNVTSATALLTFQRKLKLHLFRQSYLDIIF